MLGPEVEAICQTLEELSTQSLANYELLQQVQHRYPQAHPGDIVHAAFFSVTNSMRRNGEITSRIYDFALAARRTLRGAGTTSWSNSLATVRANMITQCVYRG